MSDTDDTPGKAVEDALQSLGHALAIVGVDGGVTVTVPWKAYVALAGDGPLGHEFHLLTQSGKMRLVPDYAPTPAAEQPRDYSRPRPGLKCTRSADPSECAYAIGGEGCPCDIRAMREWVHEKMADEARSRKPERPT